MRVLVDTTVWSAAMRRRTADGPTASALRRLVHEGRALLLGAVRQEVLSGVRERPMFERLCKTLRAFPDVPVLTADHERAAEFYNACRSQGVQGATTDFLIAAVAERLGAAVFTEDGDFKQYKPYIPLDLYEPPATDA